MGLDPKALFERLGGNFYIDSSGRKWPRFIPQVFFTEVKKTPYLKEPGLVTVVRPVIVDIEALRPFLQGFDKEYGFEAYADDPHWLEETEAIIKLAGQACYASYGPDRSHNTEEDCRRYLENAKKQRHGSIVEHPHTTFFIYGISRSLTHELVRHRIASYSQLSQRYVDGKVLRFVERPEYQNHRALHESFECWAEEVGSEYECRRELMLEYLSSQPGFDKMSARDKRKAQNQGARSCLPNETETHIYMTANLRTWRHIDEMRASHHAEVEIRNLAIRVFLCLYLIAPVTFSDYEIQELPDGTFTVETQYVKI